MYNVGFPDENGGLAADEVTIAEVLSKAGYPTAFYGKAHLGDVESSYMNNQGFDEALWTEGTNAMNHPRFDQFRLLIWTYSHAMELARPLKSARVGDSAGSGPVGAGAHRRLVLLLSRHFPLFWPY